MKEKPVGRRDPDYLPGRGAAARARGRGGGDRAAPQGAGDERRRELEAAQAALGEDAGRRSARTSWTALEPVEASSANGTRVLIQGNDFSLIATTASGPKPPRDTYTVQLQDRARRA